MAGLPMATLLWDEHRQQRFLPEFQLILLCAPQKPRLAGEQPLPSTSRGMWLGSRLCCFFGEAEQSWEQLCSLDRGSPV